MASESFSSFAHGSLMLFGEHAVLRGKLAIVYPVAEKIAVTLTPRSDDVITVNSATYGTYQTSLTKFEFHDDWRFVLRAIYNQLKKIPTGFDLLIQSEMPANIGFGSSAAVTVATLKALLTWINHEEPKAIDLFLFAKQVILDVQKTGSGADVAASVYGKLVVYRADPLEITPIEINLPIVTMYSGNKVPTTEMISRINSFEAKYPKIAAKIFAAMDKCSECAVKAIQKGDLVLLGELMNIHHGLQEAIGTCNKTLSDLIYELRAMPTIYGAKISGAGLGDCVIGLGHA
jgi:mevalonate kinase